MKFSVYNNIKDQSTDFVFRVQQEQLARAQMIRIMEKMTDRIAHVLAREYLKKKGPDLRRLVHMEFIERRVKRAIKDAIKREEK